MARFRDEMRDHDTMARFKGGMRERNITDCLYVVTENNMALLSSQNSLRGTSWSQTNSVQDQFVFFSMSAVIPEDSVFRLIISGHKSHKDKSIEVY